MQTLAMLGGIFTACFFVGSIDKQCICGYNCYGICLYKYWIRIMLRGCSILFLIILTSSTVLGSEITEIPLPQLHGLYSFNWHSKSTIINVEFELDAERIIIYNATIKLLGTIVAGSYICDMNWGIPAMWGIEFTAYIDDSFTGGYWRAFVRTPRYNSEFDFELLFTPYSNATWDFLKSCEGKLRLRVRPEYAPSGLSCSHHVYPSAVVDQAYLIIEADPIVGFADNTWGNIKALFSQ